MEHGVEVRAKFYVRSLEKFASPEGCGTVKLQPVFANQPGVEGNAATENHIFGKYTPSGEITMYIQNPAAYEKFERRLGKAFYVDFTPAD